MEGRGCMGCGGAPPPPGYGHDHGVGTWVFDLGNSCQCYGCRQKTSTIINKLQGVIEHCYNSEKNQVIVTGMVDPDYVIRKLSKLKKHVRVIFEPGFMNQPPQPLGEPPLQPLPPPPQHPPPCNGCYHDAPLLPGNHNAPPPWVNHHPVYVHSDHEPPPTTACHFPPPQFTREPPPPPPHHQAHMRPPCPECHQTHPPPPHHNCSRPPLPPPCSAGQCPPPHHNHNHNHNHQALNNPAAMVDNFIHSTSSSPLIPHNVCTAGVLGQLANIKRLKHVDLIRQKGIKLTFEDGHVTSYHPTSRMELRPAYDCAALPPPHQLSQRYVSPFSDEYPTGPSCTIV